MTSIASVTANKISKSIFAFFFCPVIILFPRFTSKIRQEPSVFPDITDKKAKTIFFPAGTPQINADVVTFTKLLLLSQQQFRKSPSAQINKNRKLF
ncbi:MAG TPA: hypothetical protein H9687_05630 [Firmicutes bacterium]|nr:hypothetical protein [Bacillota bacterium]